MEPPRCSNLTAWAQNGVLLLNTCLTVKPGQAGSHSKKGWEDFTDKVVDVVDKYGGANLAAHGSNGAGRGRGIVFLAWGAWAAKRVAKLDTVSPIQSAIPAHSPHPARLTGASLAQKKHLILKSAVSSVFGRGVDGGGPESSHTSHPLLIGSIRHR